MVCYVIKVYGVHDNFFDVYSICVSCLKGFEMVFHTIIFINHYIIFVLNQEHRLDVVYILYVLFINLDYNNVVFIVLDVNNV